MKVKNNSLYPRTVSGTRIEPGETGQIEDVQESSLHRSLEVVEKSGDSGSDQNTKNQNHESDESDNGGEIDNE